MNRIVLFFMMFFCYTCSVDAQTYKMKIEKQDGEIIIIPVNNIKQVSYITGDDSGEGSGDASDAASTLTSCVWQLYKAMDDEYGEPDFNEMEIVDYPANGYSNGYRIRFNSNGGCTIWDWRKGMWDKFDEQTPYTLKGNTLTIYWDYEGLSGYTDEDDHTTGTISFSGNTMTWQGNTPFKFKYIFTKVGE